MMKFPLPIYLFIFSIRKKKILTNISHTQSSASFCHTRLRLFAILIHSVVYFRPTQHFFVVAHDKTFKDFNMFCAEDETKMKLSDMKSKSNREATAFFPCRHNIVFMYALIPTDINMCICVWTFVC